METEGNKPYEQGGIDLDATLPGFNPEDAAAVIISDEVTLGGQESTLISSKEVGY